MRSRQKFREYSFGSQRWTVWKCVNCDASNLREDTVCVFCRPKSSQDTNEQEDKRWRCKCCHELYQSHIKECKPCGIKIDLE